MSEMTECFRNVGRRDLEALDKSDSLAPFRDRFLLPTNVIYMNGNSLGPLTRDAEEKISLAVNQEWGNELIRGWNSAGWYDLPLRLGDKIGKLIGARAAETIVADSTSINLFKAVAAACALRPKRSKIVTEAGNFPTDLYVLDGLSQFSARELDIDIRPRRELAEAIDSDTAVVVLTHVHYVSGEIFPMQEMTRLAHDAGALVVWDLSHSVGAVRTDLVAASVDFAVGCGYKHLNGGPGAPAFIYAAERHHESMQQPLSGWFGHANPFEFRDDFEAAQGMRRFLCGTTGVLGGSALEAATDVMLEADLSEMFAKTHALGRLFQTLVVDFSLDLELRLQSPPMAEQRGAHISYSHDEGYAIMQNLIEQGVIGDFRAPDFIRFGFSPLFMRYVDVYDAVVTLKKILDAGSYTDPRFARKLSVT